MTAIPEDVQLVVGLMGAMQSQASSTNWSLIQSLTVGDRTNRARLALVRDQIETLVDGPYVPNPRAVTNALYPSEATVERWLADHYQGDWRDPATPFMRCWRCAECES